MQKIEIERKFLVDKLPDLGKFKAVKYERYFLFIDEFSEIRIQKKGDIFEFERKVTQDILNAEKMKFQITEQEFLQLKKLSMGEILRTSYSISQDPEVSIKIYSGDIKGFQRIEVEFDSVRDSENFIIPDWFGKEITGSLGSRDSGICNIIFEELKSRL